MVEYNTAPNAKLMASRTMEARCTEYWQHEQMLRDEIRWAREQAKYLVKQRQQERRYKAQLQVLGLEKIGQALDSFTGVADTVKDQVTALGTPLANTLGQITALGQPLTETLGSLNGTSDKINELISTVTEVFSGFKCRVMDTDCVGNLIKVINILVNVAFADVASRLKSFFWNVFVQFGADIYKKIMSYWERPEEEHSLQVNFAIGDIMSMMKNASMKVLSVPILGSLLAILFHACMGLPGKVSFAGALKFFGERCRNLKFIFDFATGYQTLFEGVVEYIMCHVFGIEKARTDMDEYLTDFSSWAQDVIDLANVEDPLAQRLEKDERLVYKVDSLYRRGVKFASDIGEKKLDPKMNMYFQKIMKMTEEARKLCDFTGVFGNKPRMEPLVIQLFGESGVGKSGMTWPLSVDLNALFVSSVDEAQNFSNNIYFRNTEQEFWDGYVGQNVVTYDDFGQRADSATNPNEEFMELIRASNIAPYPLHMAELSEKKRTKFNSKVIILTSNQLNHNVGSLTFPDAYRRRIDLCAKVSNHKDYQKEGHSASKNERVYRLDPLKCDGPVDTRAYVIEMYNPETMVATGEKYSYDTFLAHCIDTVLVKQRRSAAVNTVLSNRIDEERFAMLRAKLQIGEEPTGLADLLAQMSFPEVDELFHDAESFTDRMKRKCREACESYKSTVTRYIEQFGTFKNILIVLGVILAGMGIWKLLSSKDKQWKPTQNPVVVKNVREAAQSGDHITRRAKVIRSEAHQSGDALTRQQRSIRTEANQSGDNITTRGKVVHTEGWFSGPCKAHSVASGFCQVCDNACSGGHGNVQGFCYICDPAWYARLGLEANSSGDCITTRRQVVKVEANLDTSVLEANTLANFQAWRDCTAQDLISTRILSNLYKITRKRGSLPLLNGLFVRDTVMLVPHHLTLQLEDTDEIEIENIFNSKFVLPVRDIKMVQLVDSMGEGKDAMLMQFPRYVNSHSDLVKHFQTMPELAQRNANVALATLRYYKSGSSLVVLGNTMAEMTTVTLSTDVGVRRIRDCIKYNLNTINGDCGSPVVCNETSFLRKIAGIHIAAANDGSSAFAQSVSQQNLLEGLAVLREVIVTDTDTIANLGLHAREHQLQFNTEYSQDKIRTLFGMAASTFAYLGKCVKTVFTPNKSDLRPSVIQGAVTKTTTKPAYLRHPTVNIMKKNLQKCGVNTPYIPSEEVDKAVNEYKTMLMQKPIQALRRVLTYEESIGGNEISSYVAGITRSTSPGYPWVFEKEFGKPGKTTWFGSDSYVYDADIKERVERLAVLAKQGIRSPFVWTDTLKDERRPLAKVDDLKTRVFASGAMDYLILFRQYFLGFMANAMENRVTNEQSIGTNPFSNDWTLTAKHLQKHGKKVFAGDFSTFDGTLNSCIMHRFVDVINEWYDDGEENATLRHVLFLDIFNSIHLCEDTFYSCTHSQPSGNPITTILNSFYNSVSMRIAFYRCAKKAGITGVDFKDVVSMVSYGDDNVVNFSDSIVDWFNQVEVTEAYATFGMIYTDEAKTGNIQPYKTLEEVAYLKRAFRQEGSMWFAPLELATCLEMCNWIRDCPNHEAATCDNIEAACRELSVHSKAVFDEWTPKLVKAFYKQTGIYPSIKTYSTYMEDMLAEY